MSYNPNRPVEGAEIDATELRAQFNGLKDLIDAVAPLTSASVLAVTTLPAGVPATATAQVVGQELRLSFQLPQGETGPSGPSFSQAIVDTVSTLNPGEAATVSAYFDGSLVRISFGIPQGQPGVPGEVTTQQLADSMAGLSGSIPSTNAIATLDGAMATPELELLRQKVNEIIVMLRR
jgi:hypothetical protein